MKGQAHKQLREFVAVKTQTTSIHYEKIGYWVKVINTVEDCICVCRQVNAMPVEYPELRHQILDASLITNL
jgi:hypothetical protein